LRGDLTPAPPGHPLSSKPPNVLGVFRFLLIGVFTMACQERGFWDYKKAPSPGGQVECGGEGVWG